MRVPKGFDKGSVKASFRCVNTGRALEGFRLYDFEP